MKKQFKLYLLTMISLCFTLIVSAQNEISGTINGSDGIPLSAANVVIKGTAVGTAADFDGNFTLSSETPFPWTLVITSAGYSANEILVDSNQDDINIVLQVSISELDEVVISASRKREKITESVASISTISSKKLEGISTMGDPLSLIKNVQGVRMVQNGVNKINISLRGQALANGTNALVLKDYRPINSQYTAILENERVALSTLDMERVEVLRGPSGALWGPGVNSGVVHFITKDPFRHPGTAIELNQSAEGQNITKIDFRHAASSDKFG